MTSMLTAPDYRTAGDDDLAVMLTRAEGDAFNAIVAEIDRRDQAGRAQQARDDRRSRAEAALRAEWYDAMHAQRMAAEAYCKGWLLSPEAKRLNAAAEQDGRVHVAEWQLWAGPAWMAGRYASEELKAFWQRWPRLTFAEFRRQRARAGRIAREQWRDRDQISEEGHDHDRDPGNRPGLAHHDPGPLRHEQAAPQAPQGGPGRHVHRSGPAPLGAGDVREAGTAARGAGGTVRGPAVTVTAADAARDVSGAAEADAYFTRARAQLDAAEAGTIPVTAPSAVAVQEPAEAARPAGTEVAVRDPSRIPGDQLLALIRDRWFGKYARFPSAAALDAVTLWAAHAHMRDENGVLVFGATPRLYLLSSEPGSGKSHVLELIGMVAPACYGLDLEPTAAGLAHSIAKEHATILLDEADVLFGAGARKSAVRAIINGGYTRHGTVLNGKGAKACRVPVFGALAMAGLDTLEKGANSETLAALMSRGVKIRMEKAAGPDAPAKMTRQAQAEALQARTWLEAWAGQVRGEASDAQPGMPEGVEGRAAQIWEPLIAVADAAGGDWPDRARAACAELVTAAPVPETGEDGETIGDQFAAFAEAFGTG